MTQKSEPLVLTVEHLKSVGVHRRAIENFAQVFPDGMPLTAAGLARATCMNGSYLAAIDKVRSVTGAGSVELREVREAEAEAHADFKATWALHRRTVLAAALAEAVRKLPTPMTLLDTETVKYICESDDCAIENS